MNSNTINHPVYYQRNGLEAIDIIEEYKMNFSRGCCFKYLWRMGLKDGEDLSKDIKKAFWYFDRECFRMAKEDGLVLADARIMLNGFFVAIFMREDLLMVEARDTLEAHLKELEAA